MDSLSQYTRIGDGHGREEGVDPDGNGLEYSPPAPISPSRWARDDAIALPSQNHRVRCVMPYCACRVDRGEDGERACFWLEEPSLLLPLP